MYTGRDLIKQKLVTGVYILPNSQKLVRGGKIYRINSGNIFSLSEKVKRRGKKGKLRKKGKRSKKEKSKEGK